MPFVKRRRTNGEFRWFAYKACTGPYSYLKHAKSQSSGPGV